MTTGTVTDTATGTITAITTGTATIAITKNPARLTKSCRRST